MVLECAAALACAWLGKLPWQNYPVMIGLLFILRRIRKSWAVDLTLLSVYGALLVASTYIGLPANSFDRARPEGHYGVIIERVLKGEVTMPDIPDPRLARLPNPHHPGERGGAPYSWDLSLYKGKYYMYWGIAPMLTVGLPYWLLTHRYLTQPTQGLVFTLLTLIFGYFLTLRLIRRIAGREPDPTDRFFAAGGAGLCSTLPVILHRIAHYEIAILGGIAFVLAGLYFLDRGRERARWLYLGGFCLGLGVASRATAVFGLFAAVAIVPALRPWRRILVGMAPSIGIAALYNFLRFDKPWEFGFRYQTNHIDFLDYYGWSDFLNGVGAFLLQPIRSQPQFPYVYMDRFGDGWLLLRHRWMNDPIVGVLFFCPFLFWVLPRIGTWFGDRRYWPLAGCVLSCLGYVAIDATAGMNLRYCAEFVIFASAAGIVWLRSQSHRKGYWFVGCALLLYSFNVCFFAALPNELAQFRDFSPRAFAALERFYGAQPSIQPPQAQTAGVVPGPHNSLYLNLGGRYYSLDDLLNRDSCGYPRMRRYPSSAK